METKKQPKKKGASKKTTGKKKPKTRGKPKTKAGLTQKKEELAQAYILCHGNQSKAYRQVYPDCATNPKTVWSVASRAFSDCKVQSRITELQELATKKHVVTVESITEELIESFDMAKDLKQPGHMTGSSNVKAKLHGLIIDRSKITSQVNLTAVPVSDLTEEQLGKELAKYGIKK